MNDSELARESGVHRDTIGAIRRGEGFRRDTWAKLDRTLTAIEHEAGIDAPPAEEYVEFVVTLPGQSDATVVVRGPGAEEAVAKLLRRLRSESET